MSSTASKSGAYRESDPVAPLGVYGRSKLAGEDAIRRHLPQHVIVRTSWVYGIYGANFLKTILRLAGERDELRIVADQSGCPTSTADLAQALLAAAQALGEGRAVSGTYHFAGTGVTTWHGFASRIVEAQRPFTGRFPSVVPIRTEDYPTPAQRPANSELDSEPVRPHLRLYGAALAKRRRRDGDAAAVAAPHDILIQSRNHRDSP